MFSDKRKNPSSTLAAALLCFWLASAQSIPSDEIRSRTVPYVPAPRVTLRTEVRVVEVPVVVRDGRRHTVAGLTRDDFEILDNGKKQVITAFSAQGSMGAQTGAGTGAGTASGPLRPRFLALCFDDLHLSPGALNQLKDAAKQFVRTGLAPEDRVAVVTTSKPNHSVFWCDAPTLLQEIDKVTFARQGIPNDDPQMCPHLWPYEAFEIANHVDPGDQLLRQKTAECSACLHVPCREGTVAGIAETIWLRARSGSVDTLGVIESLVDGLARLPGQRVLLLTSGGFLTGTLEADVDRLMDKARQAEVVINALDARGQYLNLSAGTAYDGMAALASGTGGALYHNQNNFEEGFRELGRVPETVYVLGFVPSSVPDGSFHKLKVQLAGAAAKSNSVQARLGYIASASAANAGTRTESFESKLDSEVMASDTITDLPASFTWEQWAGAQGVTMVAHLDIGHLHFKPWQDRRTQRLTIVAVVLDNQGSVVAAKRSELDLSFKEATFAQLEKSGFPVALTIKAPPGNYSVRAVAQDGIEGKLAAASGAVQIK